MDPDNEIEGGKQTPDAAHTPDADGQTSVQPDPGHTDDNTPLSSSGTDKPEPSSDGPKSMEDAIEAALKAGRENPLADDADPEGEAKESEDGEPGADGDEGDKAEDDPDKSKEAVEDGSEGEGEEDDPTDEELASYKGRPLKRIKQLLSQRNAARAEAQELRTDAENFRQVRQFMQHNDLQDREVAELFELGAHLKSGDPARLAKFIERVFPVVQQVFEATGRAIPGDLREKVESGEISEEAAKQLGRERHARMIAEAKARKAREQVQTHTDMGRVQQVQHSVAQWEAQTRAKDPDFDKKADALKRAGQALVAERGLPKTAEEAVEYASMAYDEVSRWFKEARPAPKPTRPAPSSNSSVSRAGLSPQPSSLQDAIFGAIEASTRG